MLRRSVRRGVPRVLGVRASLASWWKGVTQWTPFLYFTQLSLMGERADAFHTCRYKSTPAIYGALSIALDAEARYRVTRRLSSGSVMEQLRLL